MWLIVQWPLIFFTLFYIGMHHIMGGPQNLTARLGLWNSAFPASQLSYDVTHRRILRTEILYGRRRYNNGYLCHVFKKTPEMFPKGKSRTLHILTDEVQVNVRSTYTWLPRINIKYASLRLSVRIAMWSSPLVFTETEMIRILWIT